jgi:superfamily II DNA helicase RecQ
VTTDLDNAEHLKAEARRGLALLYQNPNAKEKSPEQLEYLMETIANQRDFIAILPTGGGKSAGWQVMAKLEPESKSIVVIPTLALMEDQISSCASLGIVAAQYKVTGQPLPPNVQVIFVQPETVDSQGFKR